MQYDRELIQKIAEITSKVQKAIKKSTSGGVKPPKMLSTKSAKTTYSKPAIKIPILKQALMRKLAKKDMPDFVDQDRPAKVKEIYKALKRDHPEYSAGKKARIASSKGV